MLAAVSVTACEGSSARVSAPRGAAAIERAAIIGGAFASGAASDGLTGESQMSAWPTLLGAQAGTTIGGIALRSPGCSAPLVAPLLLGRRLNGQTADTRDTTCAGVATNTSPPADNLAIPAATAWDALNLTPKAIAAAPAAHDVLDRLRYPLILGNTQSQVTAMLVKAPRFVAVELGLAEVARAATSGRVVPATSYADPAAWTLVPPAVFKPVFDQIADSLAKSGAAVVVLGVPKVTRLPAFQPASAIWNARTEFAGFGIQVAASCASSNNVVRVETVVPRLARRAVATGVVQPLSCADTPGATDEILTAADVAQIESAVDGINQHLATAATQRQWAFVRVDTLFEALTASSAAYQPARQLRCAEPFGSHFSLDGFHPSARGSQRIADAVATAGNARFGYRIPIRGEPFDITAPCP